MLPTQAHQSADSMMMMMMMASHRIAMLLVPAEVFRFCCFSLLLISGDFYFHLLLIEREKIIMHMLIPFHFISVPIAYIPRKMLEYFMFWKDIYVRVKFPIGLVFFFYDLTAYCPRPTHTRTLAYILFRVISIFGVKSSRNLHGISIHPIFDRSKVPFSTSTNKQIDFNESLYLTYALMVSTIMGRSYGHKVLA